MDTSRSSDVDARGWQLALLAVAMAGCFGSRAVTSGERADGLAVDCEDVGDEVYECEPDDGDDECEGWDAGGPAFVLWPPNHKMVSISVDACLDLYAACDDGDTDVDPDAIWQIAAVTSDEAVDVGAGGDGNTADYDMAIIDAHSVELRAERQGGGNGRVYRIELTSESGDAFGCEVHVPHNRGPHGGAQDSGEQVRVES